MILTYHIRAFSFQFLINACTSFLLYRDQWSRYYDNRHRARQEPHKYMFIIIDGMDQSKTDLPHLSRKNMSACNMWVMRTHLAGALAHGRRSFAFVDLHLWSHDSSLSSNILMQILHQQAASWKLPATLCLQLDDCFRETKNQFFFGFIALLVHYKVFKEVCCVYTYVLVMFPLYASTSFDIILLLYYIYDRLSWDSSW